MQQNYSVYPPPTTCEYEENHRGGCLGIVIGLVLSFIACAVLSLLAGCTPRDIEQHHRQHYEVDSLAVQAAVESRMQSWSQQLDSAWRERFSLFSAEVQSSSDEKEVTTETVITATDSLGREIRTEQRRTERTLSQQQLQLEQRLCRDYEARIRAAADSLDALWQQRYDVLQAHLEKADSSSFAKTAASDDARPLYRRLFDHFHYFINGFLIAYGLWLTRRWWLLPLHKHLKSFLP